MPIAKTATTVRTSPDDAPHADRVKPATVEVTVVSAVPPPEPSLHEATSVDESLEDPYDNIACTD
jgi:hypothetical protein